MASATDAGSHELSAGQDTQMKPVDFSSFVQDLATASGQAIMPFFRSAIHATDKSSGGVFDPVTEADHAAENVMRRMIRDTFPDHGIIGEEFGSENTDAEYVWVLDPIDGTKSFISGMPVWGTLIGLNHNGAPCYGVMHQPFTRELFSGDGQSASWQRIDAKVDTGAPTPVKKLTVRSCDGLADATLMTTHPDLLVKGTRRQFNSVERKVRLSRYGGDCYSYCMLASGCVDLIIESGINAYDIVALIPIVEGAGGVITTWDGGPAAKGGAIVAAGDPRVHEQALEILSR